MNVRSGLIGCSLLVACADSTSPLPLGSKDSPLRSLCDASPSLLMNELKLSCSVLPPGPSSRHPMYWSGPLPCRSTRTILPEQEGVAPTSVDYDYSLTNVDLSATYDADGNLATYKLTVFGIDDAITFQYADDRYVGATFQEHQYRAVYDGNLRVAEGLVGESRPQYYWTYEDDKLVAEGPPVHGAAPQRYSESMLEPDAQGNLPQVPMLTDSGASIASKAYFYDDAGRVRRIGAAVVPGTPMTRIDLSYQGDRLTTVIMEKSSTVEPSLGAQRIDYAYDCD